jgi:hypothetical protein
MVKTCQPYKPVAILGNNPDSMLYFALRVLTRQGEVLIDFGAFSDLLSWSDTLSCDGAAGNWTLRMRTTLANEELLKKLHPGLVIEAYCSRNDDPLRALKDNQGNILPPSKPVPSPVVFTGYELGTGLQISPAFADGKQPPSDPPDYLDNSPYLLMRGIITGYGRTSSVSGSGAETSLTLSGQGYGKIYQDANVYIDVNALTGIGKSLEVKWQSLIVRSTVSLYYGLLRHWLEEFWGASTGWEARVRPIPVSPYTFARFTQGGQLWDMLQYLSVRGVFNMFVDHTGAIVWTKLPWSGKAQALIDQYMTDWQQRSPLTNWEDLELYELPSWKLIAWADRLDETQLSNLIRVRKNMYAGSGGIGDAGLPGQIYNQGSINQYSGPKVREIFIPTGTGPEQVIDDPKRVKQEATVQTFQDLVALECIRWYDRPVQHVSVQVRGEAAWRIHTRVKITESWHNPKAVPGEYYVVARNHQINFQSAAWVTTMDLVRDRRTRYLGIGDEQAKGKDQKPQVEVPIAEDEYWFFNSQTAKIEAIGNDPIAFAKQAPIATYTPEPVAP